MNRYISTALFAAFLVLLALAPHVDVSTLFSDAIASEATQVVYLSDEGGAVRDVLAAETPGRSRAEMEPFYPLAIGLFILVIVIGWHFKPNPKTSESKWRS